MQVIVMKLHLSTKILRFFCVNLAQARKWKGVSSLRYRRSMFIAQIVIGKDNISDSAAEGLQREKMNANTGNVVTARTTLQGVLSFQLVYECTGSIVYMF